MISEIDAEVNIPENWNNLVTDMDTFSTRLKRGLSKYIEILFVHLFMRLLPGLL